MDSAHRNPTIGPGHVGVSIESSVVVIVARVASLNAGVFLIWLLDQARADGDFSAKGVAIVAGLNANALVLTSRIRGNGASAGGGATIVPAYRHVAVQV